MTKNIDLAIVRAALQGAALAGFGGADQGDARSVQAKVGIGKPPPPAPAATPIR